MYINDTDVLFLSPLSILEALHVCEKKILFYAAGFFHLKLTTQMLPCAHPIFPCPQHAMGEPVFTIVLYNRAYAAEDQHASISDKCIWIWDTPRTLPKQKLHVTPSRMFSDSTYTMIHQGIHVKPNP